MTGNSLEAANHVGQPPQVEVKEIPIGQFAGVDRSGANQREYLSISRGAVKSWSRPYRMR